MQRKVDLPKLVIPDKGDTRYYGDRDMFPYEIEDTDHMSSASSHDYASPTSPVISEMTRSGSAKKSTR